MGGTMCHTDLHSSENIRNRIIATSQQWMEVLSIVLQLLEVTMTTEPVSPFQGETEVEIDLSGLNLSKLGSTIRIMGSLSDQKLALQLQQISVTRFEKFPTDTAVCQAKCRSGAALEKHPKFARFNYVNWLIWTENQISCGKKILLHFKVNKHKLSSDWKLIFRKKTCIFFSGIIPAALDFAACLNGDTWNVLESELKGSFTLNFHHWKRKKKTIAIVFGKLLSRWNSPMEFLSGATPDLLAFFVLHKSLVRKDLRCQVDLLDCTLKYASPTKAAVTFLPMKVAL